MTHHPNETPEPLAQERAGEMPTVAYLRATKSGQPLWSEDCVCEDPVYPSDPDGSDDDTMSMPLVRLSDATAAIQAKDAEIAGLKAIKDAISDYHYALDLRQHGGVAQDRAFTAICEAVGMHWWHAGEEKARRDAMKGEAS